MHFLQFVKTPSIYMTLLLASFAPPSYAGGEWNMGLAVGYGQRSNPLINSDDINQYWIADIAYYADHWFFDNGDLGAVIVNQHSISLNAIVSINSDRVYFSHMNDQFVLFENDGANSPEPLPNFVKPPDRDYAVELGLELIVDKSWGHFQSQLNGDVSSTHGGMELWADYSYDILFQRWYIQPSLGFSWRSKNLNNYYYGITEKDKAQSDGYLPIYEAKSGFNSFAKMSLSYIIDKRWRWVSSIQYEKINSEAANSPIMTDDKITTVFTGIFYSFK